jgi:hypothetical protein
LLGEIQTAYAAEDLLALRTTLTPELLSYFSEELAANASRGVINRVTDVKLIHGDLAEAWREGRNDHATVAMKFGLGTVWSSERADALLRAASRARSLNCGPPFGPVAAIGCFQLSNRLDLNVTRRP